VLQRRRWVARVIVSDGVRDQVGRTSSPTVAAGGCEVVVAYEHPVGIGFVRSEVSKQASISVIGDRAVDEQA